MHVAPATRPPHAQSSTPTGAEHHGHYDCDAPHDLARENPGSAVDLTRRSDGVAPDLTERTVRVDPDLTPQNGGSGLAAAVAGFERWARDQVARRSDPTPEELAEREAIQDAWEREARDEEQERWARDARSDAFL